MKKFLVGGVIDKDGKWHGFFETHQPCDGTDQHLNCAISNRHVSPAYDTQGEAVAALYAMKDESGIEGWEVIGAKA
jgi:hypothetical protein